MTRERVTLADLLETRRWLKAELPKRLTDKHRRFLVSLVSAEPDWTLLQCPHADRLPGLLWKLLNIEKFRKTKRSAFDEHVRFLRERFES